MLFIVGEKKSHRWNNITWLLSNGWVCGDGNIDPLFVMALKIGACGAKMGVGLLYTPS